jgi:hypothetical protein
VLWYDPSSQAKLYAYFKEGYTAVDALKAWVHAAEVARSSRGNDLALAIQETHASLEELFPRFTQAMRKAGWLVDEGAILTSAPRSLIVGDSIEDSKKTQ